MMLKLNSSIVTGCWWILLEGPTCWCHRGNSVSTVTSVSAPICNWWNPDLNYIQYLWPKCGTELVSTWWGLCMRQRKATSTQSPCQTTFPSGLRQHHCSLKVLKVLPSFCMFDTFCQHGWPKDVQSDQGRGICQWDQHLSFDDDRC